MKNGQDTQAGCCPEHPALAENEQPAAVDNVRKGPGGKRQQKHRQGARRLNQRDHQRRRRKLRHKPACPHLLHHRADIGGDGGNPEEAEKLMLEGDPGRRDGMVLPALIRQARTCGGLLCS